MRKTKQKTKRNKSKYRNKEKLDKYINIQNTKFLPKCGIHQYRAITTEIKSTSAKMGHKYIQDLASLKYTKRQAKNGSYIYTRSINIYKDQLVSKYTKRQVSKLKETEISKNDKCLP